ncbi:hypothetical protein [Frateuria defendens]|uniref:hypothetical protein n=1 Tax=Frateuria defendens TaxID=2219559 RepID=UPI00066FD6DA|nr:hypothetical protein [Frateuria defendens]
MTSAAPQRTAAAAHAIRSLLDFLTKLTSTSDITLDQVGKQFGGTLTSEDGAFVYRSPDIGGGWNYGVKVFLPKPDMKAGFNFWFYNPDSAADLGAICELSLDALRQALLAHGYAEKFSPSEIGGVDWVNFVKADIVLTVTRRDVVMTDQGTQCLMGLGTTDAR